MTFLRPTATDLGRVVTVQTESGPRELDIYSEEGFWALAHLWTRAGWQRRLSYEVTWAGVPIIQVPEDIVMLQELLWKVRPDVVVESGVAHGGALVLYASILELLGRGHVIGVDLEIRKYNRLALESHPLSKRITLVEGDSVADETVAAVRKLVRPGDCVVVALDSNHSRQHVAAELERYAPMVSPGSYMVVFDGVMPMVADAPSGVPAWRDDNPSAALDAFLEGNDEFEIDPSYNRLGVSYCPGGFVRRRTVDERRPPRGGGSSTS